VFGPIKFSRFLLFCKSIAPSTYKTIENAAENITAADEQTHPAEQPITLRPTAAKKDIESPTKTAR